MARATIIQSNGSEVAQNPEFINFSSNFSAALDNEGGVDVDIAQTGFTVTNTTTNNTISVDQNGNVGTDVSTDGAVHIENTGNTGIGLGVYTNIGATADAALVDIFADNTAFDQTVVNIHNDGAGKGLEIRQDGSNNALSVIHTVAGAVNAVNIDCNSGGRAIFIDHDDTGSNASIDIDRDANTASLVSAIKIAVANAGAGEASAFSFDGSEVVSAAVGGSQDKKIRVDVGGTEYFIACNTA